jgi:hypothetical protein
MMIMAEEAAMPGNWKLGSSNVCCFSFWIGFVFCSSYLLCLSFASSWIIALG